MQDAHLYRYCFIMKHIVRVGGQCNEHDSSFLAGTVVVPVGVLEETKGNDFLSAVHPVSSRF